MAATEIPLLGPLINKLFGTANERVVKRYLVRVEQINALESQVRALTDEQIRNATVELKARIKKGEKAIDALPEAFAIAREAMDRNVGIRNIFNPKYAELFDPSRLPADIRAKYEALKAQMEATPAREPTGDLLGNTEPMPAWIWTDIPNEIYEAVRVLYPESKPPFRARPFDVQLLGAMVLYGGKIAEMRTGEGKTIVGPLACYMAVLDGFRVHVVTVNDYLVQRDRDWTFPFFRGLGLTVGAIHPHHMQPEDMKRVMYACDVVYGTTAEFGFDYLRDNMKRSADQQVQRSREFAIVDEVDSILIDEARTPLIISGPAHEDSPRYELADQLARHLVKMNKPRSDAEKRVEDHKKLIKGTEGDIRNARDKAAVPALQDRLNQLKAELPQIEKERDRFTQYFETERERKQCHVTHMGIVEAQKKADIGSFFVGDNIDMPHLLQQSVRAHVVYERDVDYVVMPTPDQNSGRTEPDVVIVDVNTGRPMVGRTWSDGLHQSIQAKEGLRIRQENQTVATVTIQNFFKMYKRLAGMTGTADTEAQEFYDIYKLDVVSIPTNLPIVRADFDDVVYLVAKDKWGAIVDEIKAFHDVGRPVLVGTTSVEKSETLSRMLTGKHNIKHEVLNAKQHEREAHIIENAGQLGAVMIATNMAGRGTDIKLPKVTREQLLDHWLRRGLAPRELTVEMPDEKVRELVYRKIAPKELNIQKRDADAMAFDELELQLLRTWTKAYTFLEPKRVDALNADELREALDAQGRFKLHRLRWVETIEDLGGLHVIGTERHESRRIDNQLRGRSGRQGDKGSSRFFVSLEDDLMQMFAGETTMKILSRLGMKEGDAIEHPMLSKSIVRAQRKVEERNFQIRKQILEYDEVMEHQRRDFYGTRQRVLDGRDIKGLIFEYVEQASASAVAKYLDKDYAAECIAVVASERLGTSIAPERCRGKDFDEIVATVRREATDECRHEIGVTMGEYFPSENVDAPGVDKTGIDHSEVDAKGLASWAASRFGVELTEHDIRTMSAAQIKHRLLDAAVERIREADFSDLDRYVKKEFGPEELSKWLKNSMDLDISAADIMAKENPDQVVDMVLDQVRAAYAKREIEYPVEFALDLTMALMRQNPQGAAQHLVNWANQRYQLGWDESVLRTKMPKQIQDDLQKASKQWVESGALQKAVDEAQACPDIEALEKHFAERYQVGLPHWLKRLKGDELKDAIRARVEGLLRAELVQFERFVLLEVLDPQWKDHLYAMDQLRDAIGFRAFSQQDPRIEYKKEGTRLYKAMLERVRDRVTELVFRVRVKPQVNAAPPMRQPAPGPTGAAPQRPAVLPLGGSSTISGPGFGA